MMKQIRAKDIMSRDVIFVPADWTVREVAQLFVEKSITGAPVVEENGKLVGVVSLMDIARHQTFSDLPVSEERPHDYYLLGWEDKYDADDIRAFHVEAPANVLVREIMTPIVFKVEADVPVQEIAKIMVHGRIHRVVVTEAERAIGIITALDLVKLIEESWPAGEAR